MLKPRYGTLAESIGDFNRMLDGMNKVQPLERKFTDDIQEMFTHEQKLVGLEKQIEHAHRVASGSGLQMDVTESDNLAAMHAHAADMYGQAAVKAAETVREATAVNNRQMAERFQGIVNRFREKAMEHQQQAKRSDKVVAESKQPKRSSLMENMRVLAGIEERTLYPRDPGVLGTTRFNEGYQQMAECGCDDDHERSEKKDIKKIKKSADKLDNMHKGVK